MDSICSPKELGIPLSQFVAHGFFLRVYGRRVGYQKLARCLSEMHFKSTFSRFNDRNFDQDTDGYFNAEIA